MPIIGDIILAQSETVVDQIAIKQEWTNVENCQATTVHFLQLPQEGVGIRGNVIREGQKAELFDSCAAKGNGQVEATHPPSSMEPTEIHHVSFMKCDC